MSQHSQGSHRPTDGDVVIRREGSRFTVRCVPGQPQVTCDTRVLALRMAREFAARARRRVWDEDNGVLRPLD